MDRDAQAGAVGPSSWALPLLRCPACERGSLETGGGALGSFLLCQQCAERWPAEAGVFHLLSAPREEVARERVAVARLDQQGAGNAQGKERRTERLRQLFAGQLSRDQSTGDPYLEHAWEVRQRTLEVLALEPLRPDETLLELGADHGWGSGLLLDAGARVIALDINDHLRNAPRRDDPNLALVQADMNHLPCQDSSLDVVWATAAAHHSWDLATCFQEAYRVLKPGGRLYFICEPMPSWLRFALQRNVGAEERALGIHETWIRRGRWRKLCERAGFEPRLAYPELSDSEIRKRLQGHRLPGFLAPIVRPALRLLQVSMHLLARKPA